MSIIENYQKHKEYLTEELKINFPQTDDEFVNLCNEIHKRGEEPQVFVEIGTRHGGSLYMISRFLPKGSIIVSIDLPGAGWGHRDSQKNRNMICNILTNEGFMVHQITEDSQIEETKDKLKNILWDKEIDFLFIDGDHRLQGVVKDFRLYMPLVKRGGLIAFHDIKEFKNAKGTKSKIGVYVLWEILEHLCETKKWISDKGSGIGLVIKN